MERLRIRQTDMVTNAMEEVWKDEVLQNEFEQMFGIAGNYEVQEMSTQYNRKYIQRIAVFVWQILLSYAYTRQCLMDLSSDCMLFKQVSSAKFSQGLSRPKFPCTQESLNIEKRRYAKAVDES